jgi:branched-subunit amino acid transport protein
MAGPLALALVLGLASLSFIMRATGPFLPNLPSAVTERTAGLAPALLAALVAIQLTGPHGLLHLDVKVPAVFVAAVLAAVRAPFIVCVVAGALVAALLRALFHFN